MTRPQAMETARRMYANGEGWSLTEIRHYLAQHGHHVTVTTIKTWADPEYAEQRRVAHMLRERRRRRDSDGTRGFLVLDDDARRRLGLEIPEPSTPELTPDLLLALRVEDQLTYTAIAKVARRFFGEDMSEDQARFRLYELGVEKNPNKARANRARNGEVAA